MRTLDSGTQRALEDPNRSTHARVKLSADAGVTFIDMTTLGGRNWLQSISYGGGTDTPVAAATVMLKRQAENLNLAPLMTSKFSRQHGVLPDISNKIIIEVAVLAHDQERPGENEWVEVFRGEVDEIDSSKDPLVLKCRDQGHLLVDTFIETQRVYGSPGGIAIETVIQSLLDDNINTPGLGGFSVGGPLELYSVNGTGAPAFNPADSPGFNIRSYIQSKESLLSAIRRLAQMVGADVKYRFQTPTSQFQLVWVLPLRPIAAQGTLAFTGQPSDGETFTVNATTFTARSAAPGVNEYLIASTLADTCENAAAALRASTETLSADALRAATSVLIEWGVAGTVGNSIVFTEAITNATADGGGTLGGTRAGAGGTTTPDFTFNKDRYYSIDRLSISKQRIRNVIRITFEDPDDENNRFTVLRTDFASITKYGRRAMEITEASTSQIDTVPEAATLAELAKNDLSEPDVDQVVPMPFFWPVEDADLYRFEANDQHYDTDQDLAVVKFQHQLSEGKAQTSLSVRGKPAGGIDRWFVLEGDNVRNPASDLRNDDAASTLSTESNVGVLIVTYDDPRTTEPAVPDWLYTECHVNAGAGDFIPSAATLKMKGRTTRFEIGGLTPGDTFAVKLVIVDEQGNKATTSTFIDQATQRVGPFHENNDAQIDQLLRNPDFNIFTLDSATNPPDFWSVVSPHSWGAANEVFFDQTDVETGDKSVSIEVIDTTQEPAIDSDFLPLRAGEIVAGHVLAKSSNGSPGASYRFRFFDSSQSFISETTGINFATTTSFELFNTFVFEAPATTRYIRVRIAATGGTGTLFLDRVGLTRSLVQWQERALGSQSLTAGVTTTALFASGGFEIGASFSSGEITVNFPGLFMVHTYLTITSTSAHLARVFIEHDDGSGFTEIVQSKLASVSDLSTNISHHQLTTPLIEAAEGDKFRVRVLSDVAATISGANPNFPRNAFDGNQLVRND